MIRLPRALLPLALGLAAVGCIEETEEAPRLDDQGGASADERLATGYRLACARKADAESLATLRGGLESRLAEFRARPGAAAKLIAHGDSKPAAGLDPAELAAYTVTANLLLNLDRVVTRD